MFRWVPRTMPMTVCTLLFPLSALAQTPEPLTEPFAIHATTSSQIGADIASNGGHYVVAWREADGGGIGGRLRAQRLTVEGELLGDDVLVVETQPPWSPSFPRVGVDDQGGFVVVWSQQTSNPAEESEVRARRFGSSGSPQGSEIAVNTFTTGTQYSADIAVLGSGEFIVSWANDTSEGDILAQRFDSQGQHLGPAIQVAPPTQIHSEPLVTANGQGDFLVAWRLNEPGDPEHRLQGQRFGFDGQPIGNTLSLTPALPESLGRFRLDSNHAGQLAIVWTGTVNFESTVLARRFQALGQPLGPIFRISPTMTVSQRNANVAVNDDGSFQVFWVDASQSSAAVVGQRIDVEGKLEGQPWQASLEPVNDSWIHAVSSTSDHQFLTVWTDVMGTWDVYGRAYLVTTLFTDGFESGHTSAWSASTP